MGLYSKKSVPVRFRGRNLQNVTAKLTRRGIEPWEVQMNEQEEELILNAIERNLGIQLRNANEIRRRIINQGNAVEYNVVVYENNNMNINNNNNNEEILEQERLNQERLEQEEINENYRRWAEGHLLNMMNRRGGRKTSKKHLKRRKTQRKRK
jgi:hypothetical protein